MRYEDPIAHEWMTSYTAPGTAANFCQASLGSWEKFYLNFSRKRAARNGSASMILHAPTLSHPYGVCPVLSENSTGRVRETYTSCACIGPPPLSTSCVRTSSTGRHPVFLIWNGFWNSSRLSIALGFQSKNKPT